MNTQIATAATLLLEHRGYKVTDEPYGSEPFTIYSPDGKVIDHCDEETVQECIATIDVIEDEHQAAERRELENATGTFYGNYPETYDNIRA
jgi:hypothetical protein